MGLSGLAIKYRKQLIVFATAFSLRLLPEMISWPWLIGWDTPEYVASLKDFVVSPTILEKSVWYGRRRLLPPLLNVLLYPLALLVDPWYVFKVISPIIYGFEALSFYYLMKSLDIDERTEYLSTLIFIFYPVSLRFSWDLYRNSLGLVFLIGLMYELIKGNRSWKIFLLSLGAFLSNEFTFALSFLLVGLSVLIDVSRTHSLEFSKLAALFTGSLPIYLFSATSSPFVLINPCQMAPLEVIEDKVLPTLVLFFPLLLLLPLGFKKVIDAKREGGMYIGVFLLMVLFFSFSDTILPIRFPVWSRWMYHMVIPLSVYAGVGLRDKKWRSVYLAVILLLGVTFSTLPYPITSSGEISATAGELKLSGFDLDPSSLIGILKSVSRGTRMTYTMMHSTVPLQLEAQYVNASKYISNMSFNRLIVDPEGYGFVHIERRFGLNVSIVHLKMEWEVPRKLIRDLLGENIKEFYILGRGGMKLTVKKDILPMGYRLVVERLREFGSLTLYRCTLTNS